MINANELIGRVLDGRYKVEAVLGQGGMGMVFRGLQTSVQRPVAIKTLHPQLALAPTFFERFKREAEMASRLHYPNIITIYREPPQSTLESHLYGLEAAAAPGLEDRGARRARPVTAKNPPPKAESPKVEATHARVVLKTTPVGAEVLEGGVVIGNTPLTLNWPRGTTRELTFKLEGHKDLVKSLRSEADQSFDFLLELASPKPLPGKKPPQKRGADIGAFD